MAQDNFSYDPSASIEKSFANVQQNIGNIFSGIIAQKQQDFALADKVFQNLDAITEQTAAIGSARINQGIKDLTNQAATNVYKDGKMNFDALGQISQGVMKIKQLKNYWAGAAEIKKQVLQQAAASNKDMVSLSSFISKLDPLIAENEGGSTTDLQKKIASLYDSHLDYTKIAQEKLTSVIPVDEVKGNIMNEKGGKDAYSFQGLKGMIFDDKTKKVVLPPDEMVVDPSTGKPVLDPATGKPQTISFLAKAKAVLSAGDPDFFNNWKRHYGTSEALVSDDAVTMQIINSLKTNPQFSELKSKEQLDKEKNEAKTSGIEAKYAETFSALKIKQINASIQASIAQANKANASAFGKTGATGAPKGFVTPKIGMTKDGSRYMTLTNPVTITATGANQGAIQKGGKAAEFEINKISINKDNKIVATGSIVSGGLVSRKGEVRSIILSKPDYEAFINRLGGTPAVHRYSNTLGLRELGLTDIPDSYLNIQQDTNPNLTQDTAWENVD
jgi:hypothetical protein